MSVKPIFVCEGCGATSDNYAAEKGWLWLNGALTQYRGVLDKRTGQYRGDAIPYAVSHHYCSFKCLERALAKRRAS